MKISKGKNKFVSIQKQLVARNTRYMCGLSFVMLLLIISTATLLTQDTLKLTMTQIAENGAHNLTNQINTYTLCMNGISDSPYFANPAANRDQVVARLQTKTETYWAFTSFIDLDGNDYMTGENHSGKDFFNRPLSSSDTYVSSPQYRDDGYYFIFSVAAKYNDEVIGVFYMISNYEYFASLLDSTTVGETGKTYVVTKSDKVIIDEDIGTGIQVGASNHLNKNESQLEMEKTAESGEVGFSNYWGETSNRVAGYAPVAGTDDWILITTADSNEFLKNFTIVMGFAVFVAIFSVCLCVYLNIRSIKKFIVPINQCVDRIVTLAKGDVYSPVPAITSRNEAGLLAKGTEDIVGSIAQILKDEENLLQSMANGDFTKESHCPEAYVGDFAVLLSSLTLIKGKLNRTLTEISHSSTQVNGAAGIVSMSACNLAEGTAQQETSARQLVKAFSIITEEVENSSTRATAIRDGIKRTGEEVHLGQTQLNELVLAMEDISESAQKIEDIIKGIEAIAFQTNILALNASVEAARAGTSGRGFAVVADEVRNLSIRSTSHVEATAGLVDVTIRAIENGRKIVQSTSENMNNIVAEVENAVEGTREISEAMERQSSAVLTIGKSMEEISVVIENTSATSEESASTSEELSAFADSLQTMVAEFKLKEDTFGSKK
ncbi:MAG: methyl-accepting chemotaxis protein [Eubacteriales bacterium]